MNTNKKDNKTDLVLDINLFDTFNSYSYFFSVIANLCVILTLEDNHKVLIKPSFSEHFLDSKNIYDEDKDVTLFFFSLPSSLVRIFFFVMQFFVCIF